MFAQVNVITDVVVILNLVRTGEPASRRAETPHTSFSANVAKDLVEEFVRFLIHVPLIALSLSQISIQFKQPTANI
jgi:hypothetical protein